MNHPIIQNAVPMSAPDIDESDIAAVVRVLRSGQLSIGPCIEEFEARFARFLGVRHAVAVANGTAALHLCMRLAGISEGSEVITSPYSFVASANCILFERGLPVFVDIDEETMNIDAGLAEAAVGPRTRAILPVHVFGQPAAMAPLMDIAHRHSLYLIEDACEAIGAEYRGRKAGSFGHASAFAFYPNKQMTTGEGGIVVTDNAGWAAQLRSMRNQGRSDGQRWLEHDRLGFNYRMDEMNAALGVSQLSRIETLLERRAAVATCYRELLAEIPGVRPLAPGPDTTRMSWFVYVVRFAEGLPRDEIARRLARQGIPTRNYFPPIHLQPFYQREFGFRPGQFPVAERVSATSLALPFHSNLRPTEVERVCEVLAEAVAALS